MIMKILNLKNLFFMIVFWLNNSNSLFLGLKSIRENKYNIFGYVIFGNEKNFSFIQYYSYLNNFKEKMCDELNYDDLYSIISPCPLKNHQNLRFSKLIYKYNKTFQM